jgi:acetoacetyl-CoA synthetase
MREETLLWSPDDETRKNANINFYLQWLNQNRNLSFDNYDDLWSWSITHVDDFWGSIWQYFEVWSDGQYTKVVEGHMPNAKWFNGARLNYAEHIFRQETDKRPAIIFKSEHSSVQTISWAELKSMVTSFQGLLPDLQVGDRVAGYLPCIPEASAAMLATTALGCIWSSCSPDFGTNAVIDRFRQIEPKVLVAVDSYQYNGKSFDKREVIQELINELPSLQLVIVIGTSADFDTKIKVIKWSDVVRKKYTELKFLRVPFDHPLWILYSSGTTGLPKAITHSHGGILLEQLKYGTFHNDFKEGEQAFWYTTTGWMMWNYIHGSLLAGCTMILYDGSPSYPDMNVLWDFAERTGMHHFGTSAAFILACQKAGINPGKNYQLTNLRSIGSTGSTLPPEGFQWIYDNVKDNLWLASMSGGTDVCSAFVGGNPTLNVYAGEIQCRALGCSLFAFDEGGEIITEAEGEMVITKPMPSMPVFFWNDPEFKRYTESYFEMFPSAWRHGDWIEITKRGGVIIYGRSDATLNRGGIRIGTSEIYRSVDKVKEVKDSLIVCIELKGGAFWMPLFVVMHEGHTLSEEVKKKINSVIRSENSPRHVPDEIMAAPDIPYTISGKKTETPVKKILMGKDPAKVANAGSLRNPQSMDFFIALQKK